MCHNYPAITVPKTINAKPLTYSSIFLRYIYMQTTVPNFGHSHITNFQSLVRNVSNKSQPVRKTDTVDISFLFKFPQTHLLKQKNEHTVVQAYRAKRSRHVDFVISPIILLHNQAVNTNLLCTQLSPLYKGNRGFIIQHGAIKPVAQP